MVELLRSDRAIASGLNILLGRFVKILIHNPGNDARRMGFKAAAMMMGGLLSGCAIYPLNREYDARIYDKGESALSVGVSRPEERDRFRDSAATLPRPFVAGYSAGFRASSLLSSNESGLLSAFLDRLEVGIGGVPIPFLFTLNTYGKFNILKMPTHTFVSVFGNAYGAQLVAEYEGYAVRGGGVLTQEIFWSAKTNVAVSTGVMFQRYHFAFYEATKTDNAPDNISRSSKGFYVPMSIIMIHKNLYLQGSLDQVIREKNRYTISVYPEDVKPIPYIGTRPHNINLSIGYRSPF